jgi:hypothetical protein
MARGNHYGIDLGKAQFSLETLQKLSFEIIVASMRMWRTYQETDKSKGRKIAVGLSIHNALMNAMKLHPDIQQLAEIRKMADEIDNEYELAVKAGIIKPRPEKRKTENDK